MLNDPDWLFPAGLSRNHILNIVIFWDMARCDPYVNLLHAGFFVRLIFYPEDGGDTFLRNVGSHRDCTVLYQVKW
jgi:hypothetical protein